MPTKRFLPLLLLPFVLLTVFLSNCVCHFSSLYALKHISICSLFVFSSAKLLGISSNEKYLISVVSMFFMNFPPSKLQRTNTLHIPYAYIGLLCLFLS